MSFRAHRRRRGQSPHAAQERARERRTICHVVKLSSSLYDSEVTHPFIRACLGTTTCGAGEDPTEERRPLNHGSHVRPDLLARSLLQLDDLTDRTAMAVFRR